MGRCCWCDTRRVSWRPYFAHSERDSMGSGERTLSLRRHGGPSARRKESAESATADMGLGAAR